MQSLRNVIHDISSASWVVDDPYQSTHADPLHRLSVGVSHQLNKKMFLYVELCTTHGHGSGRGSRLKPLRTGVIGWENAKTDELDRNGILQAHRHPRDRQRKREQFGWCRLLSSVVFICSCLDPWCAELCCIHLQFWVLNLVGSVSLPPFLPPSLRDTFRFFLDWREFRPQLPQGDCLQACSLWLQNRQVWDCKTAKTSYMLKVLDKEKIRSKTKD